MAISNESTKEAKLIGDKYKLSKEAIMAIAQALDLAFQDGVRCEQTCSTLSRSINERKIE